MATTNQNPIAEADPKKGKSNSEAGHAKTIAFFDEIISASIGYGTAYNPSKANIKVAAMQATSTNAKNALSAVNAAIPAYSNAVAAREIAFLPLTKLSTRILNALKATDTPQQVIDNAKTIVRKLQGSRAKPKKTDEQIESLAAKGITVKEISASQLSFDNKLDNLDKLIKQLGAATLYIPNEGDLKVASLTALYNDLKLKNNAVLTTSTPLFNARFMRNELLYKPGTGIVDTALAAKTYIKSVFGATSPQYKQIAKTRFRNVKY
ncbi:MAG: hypothetical protein WCK02_09355 [Bacteroidota bacterium]